MDNSQKQHKTKYELHHENYNYHTERAWLMRGICAPIHIFHKVQARQAYDAMADMAELIPTEKLFHDLDFQP